MKNKRPEEETNEVHKKRKCMVQDVSFDLVRGNKEEQLWFQLLQFMIPSLPSVVVDMILEYNVFRIRRMDLVDACDTVNEWCPAIVVSQTNDKVGIHYLTWHSMNDEWLHVSSERLAPFRYHTLPVWYDGLGKHVYTREAAQSSLARARELGEFELDDIEPSIRLALQQPSGWIKDDEEPYSENWHTTHDQCHTKCTLSAIPNV